jgi:hypothetical protein
VKWACNFPSATSSGWHPGAGGTGAAWLHLRHIRRRVGRIGRCYNRASFTRTRARSQRGCPGGDVPARRRPALLSKHYPVHPGLLWVSAVFSNRGRPAADSARSCIAPASGSGVMHGLIPDFMATHASIKICTSDVARILSTISERKLRWRVI